MKKNGVSACVAEIWKRAGCAGTLHGRGHFKIWIPPSVGEQVSIACIGGNPETAIILGSLYSNDHPAPGNSLKEIVIKAPDGAVVRYDADTSALEATGMKTAKLEATVSVTLDTLLWSALNI